jgi:hypothetical protein
MTVSINQLNRACQGKTHTMGGLNVSEIRTYLKVHTGTRAKLQQTLKDKLACGAFSLEDCGRCLGRRQTVCSWICTTSGQPCRRETIGSGIDRCFQHVMKDLRVWSSRDLVSLIRLMEQGVDLPMTRLARLGYIKRLSHHVHQRSVVPMYQSDLMTTITGFLADEDVHANLMMYERLQVTHPQAANTFRRNVRSLRAPDATDAVIRQIVATFPNVHRLSCRHNRILTDMGVPRLQTLKLYDRVRRITTAGIQALSRLTNLRELDLRMTTNLTLAGLRSLCTLTNLQKLDLGYCGETLPADEGVHLLSTLTQLQELRLDRWKQLTDAGVHSLPQLEILSLNECTLLTDAAVQSLCAMTRLENLFLPDSPWLTDSGVKALASSLTQVKSLSMDDCRNLVDLDLSNCTRLESLSLSGCWNIVDLDLSNCTRLQDVSLYACINLSEQTVSTVVQSLSKLLRLTELNLSYCNITAEDLRSLSGLVMLTGLVLFGNPLITDAAIRSVTDRSLLRKLYLGGQFDDFDNPHNLTVLDVSKLPHLEYLNVGQCPKLTDLDLSTCTQLRELTLEECELITDHTLLSLSVSIPLRDLQISFGRDGITGAGLSGFTLLQRLSLISCDYIVDWSFLSMLTQIRELAVRFCDEFTSLDLSTLTQIRELSVTDCFGLTDLDLSTLAHLTSVDFTGCENLGGLRLSQSAQITSLCLDGCENISNAVVLSLSVLGNLETLDLSGCQKITDETVRYLASTLTRLETLKLTDCPRITNHGVRSLSIGRGQGTGDSRKMVKGRWI